MLPLQTARLEIRPFVPDDLEPLHAVYGDPEVMRWSGGAYTPERSEAALAEHIGKHAEEGIAFWAVIERASGALIGDAGLGRQGDEVELGYTLGRPWWGRGYATEAARACLAEAFGPLGLERVIAVVRPENAASIRVVEKLGMRPDGRMSAHGAEHLRFVAERRGRDAA